MHLLRYPGQSIRRQSNRIHRRGSASNLASERPSRSPLVPRLCKDSQRSHFNSWSNHTRTRREKNTAAAGTSTSSGCGHDLTRRLNQWLVRESPCQAIHEAMLSSVESPRYLSIGCQLSLSSLLFLLLLRTWSTDRYTTTPLPTEHPECWTDLSQQHHHHHCSLISHRLRIPPS